MSTRAKLIVLSGPSGSGKSTLIDRLLTNPPIPLEISASVTTRPQREDDRHTKRYIYLGESEFQRARQSGSLLECAEVSGHWYGTPREPVERALAEGRSVLLEIDVQGGMAVRNIYPDCLMIFLKAPSLEEYERRIRHRGTNSEAEIQRRLEAARRELEQAGQYHYQLINDDLDRAVKQLREILERCGGTVCA